jgi:uncharacterized protein YecE (DUF72 family)
VGPFYPPGTPPAGFLAEYARHFDTVEVDSSFYRPPSAAMVRNWRERTPPGFVFAAKVPRVVTHEKVLQDCDTELKQFLAVMDLLGDKLGPLLLQFPYFNKKVFSRPEDFVARLKPFLERLPSGYSFAVEVRNKNFLGAPLLGLLRNYQIALALIDHPWMPPIGELAGRFDLATADFCYLRFLGDRKGIEEKTQHWDKVIVNRQREMEAWIPEIRRLLERQRLVYAYFNNHYAGFAPASLELFHEVWAKLPAGA